MTLPEAAATTCTGARTLRRCARLAVVLLPPVSMVAALTLSAPSASANPPGPHDPIGQVEKVAANPGASVRFVGWAADPDTTGNVGIVGLVDGRWRASGVTSIPRHWIAKLHKTGPTPGFDLSVPVSSAGLHTVCVAVRNVGTGLWRMLRCVATPLGTTLTSQQRSTHDPSGSVSSTTATSSTIRVTGWAREPDFLSGRMLAVLYVDGQPAVTALTRRATAAQRAAGAGKRGAIDITVRVSSGTHLACVWLVDTGFGSNSSLGCKTADTRGRPGTGAVPRPVANAAVVKEAKRHIGQAYVWGAAGPKTFDCSGLVIFSYHKAGVETPRVAADQFVAARLIPPSRAVAGDLVFHHDNVGSVYHVGIYLSPGETVAAIDEQQGVARQHIWDPSSATYGSFTHT